MIIDGHISRMGTDFLAYCNGVDLEKMKTVAPVDMDAFLAQCKPRWKVIVGASYGTGFWQGHDDKAMNGRFKANLYKEKLTLVTKKRAIGLAGEIEKVEVVVLVCKAAQNSFAVVTYGESALLATGWNPATKAPLDLPEILQSAPEDVRKERTEILTEFLKFQSIKIQTKENQFR